MASLSERRDANVEGDFFVDRSCIDCGTCRWIAPHSFDLLGGRSRVYQQPRDASETEANLRALVSCPTSSIGTVDAHDVRTVAAEFPYPVAPNVYHCGYHHRRSFGATSYLITRPEGNVLVDSPRFAAPLVRRITELGGVDLMFLTHRDDVADHARFAEHFGCTRVLHRDDVDPSTTDVERQPEGLDPVELAPDLLMLPVPGHTRGSACLLYRGQVLFTGDHLAWHMAREQLYAFSGACWYDWATQIESMRRLASYSFEHVLPGHGAPRQLPAAQMRQQMQACIEWMLQQPA